MKTEKVKSRKLTNGIWDEFVIDSLIDKICLSGDDAANKFDKLLSRITEKRFEYFVFLIDTIRLFGGRTEFAHASDFDANEISEEYVYMEGNHGVEGAYHDSDSWIVIPLDRHSNWKSLETTLQHEAIHLLQHAVNRDSVGCDGMICDKVRWGSWLANALRNDWADDDDPLPLHEREAYTLMSWKATFKDWAEEVFSRALWTGWSCEVYSD